MPRGSEELTNARKEEIINACAMLYETMSFKDITMKEIGKVTTFTRTSIYNYFQTKEEIFLALLKREYDCWRADLKRLYDENEYMSVEAFADGVARTLEKRGRMLKILSMNHYDMEGSSRMEKLVEFKITYGHTLQTFTCCLKKFFPEMTQQEIQMFIYAFFPFLFGVYPYTVVTDKQQEAMKSAKTEYVLMSLYDITFSCIKTLLKK